MKIVGPNVPIVGDNIQVNVSSFQELKTLVFPKIEEIIDGFLQNKQYSKQGSIEWSNFLNNTIIQLLTTQVKSIFKFSVNSIILKKAEVNLHLGSSSFWDPNTDGSMMIQREYPSMYCLVIINGMTF